MMVSFMQCLRSNSVPNKVTLLLSVLLFGLYACSAENNEKISRITTENVRLVENSGSLALTGDVAVELEKTLIEALRKGVPLQFNSKFRIFKFSFLVCVHVPQRIMRKFLE